MDFADRRRSLVLGVCCLSLLIAGLDTTALNIALPAIQHDLNASVSGLQWTVDGYTLAVAGFLVFAGSAGDRLGRRRVFQTGLALFTLGSLACSLAPGLGWLVGFRVLQGLGASMLNPVALSILTNTFVDPRERARAIGLWGGTIGLSLALGPVVGGLLVASAGWRSVFWINLPIGVAAIALTALFVPESKALVARRPDPVGQVLVIAFLVSVVYAIIEGAHAGFGSIPIILLFTAGTLAAAVLVRYERRRDQPLIDPRFFRSVPFAGATVIAVAAFVTMSGFLFLNTLYLQDVRGYSALRAGLLTVPMAGAAAIASAVSGRITATRGARGPLVAAGALIATAAVVLTFVAPGTPLPLLLASYVLFGTGFGLVNTPITNTAVAGMPRAEAGVSAAVATTGRQFGNSLGVAILGSIVAGKAPGEFLTASHIGWWVLAGCGALVAILGVATTTKWAQVSAGRVAERFLASPGPVTGAEAEATTA
ncbi:MFS transporter [Amycolatopsis pithecellobii]|uniref:DHA2 family efflux MFS transporter permease subunit n=1 Tax=Amycolatopsis pithecellobii TaxID=664692 RepID=A0A6N7ZD56_9PSEU|nr:MFS transporter [Amycolatopsis pithecellobii]MTD59616.1 DHA2 family efflux MFS transporter permease subunit [Amycolatopsis pithecellobii]